MRRFLAALLSLVSLPIAYAVAAAWVHGLGHVDESRFLWHGQRRELHSVGWRLSLDNEPQRQAESDAPRAEAYRLLDRLDEIDFLPHYQQRIFEHYRIGSSTRDDQQFKRSAKLATEERAILSQVAALGYVPSLICGGSSRIPMYLLLTRIRPEDWPQFRVERHNGDPVFLFQPPLPQPTTHAASVTIPYPLLLALALVLPIRTARRLITTVQRYRRGLCPTCGYDLWVNHGYCPECGVPVPDRRVWIRRLSHAYCVARRTFERLRAAWAVLTPRTEHLQERWFVYIVAWLAIFQFPIILFDIVTEVFQARPDWGRVGLGVVRLLLDGVTAAGSVLLTRGVGTTEKSRSLPPGKTRIG